MIFESLNDWLMANQLLYISVIMPVISGLVALGSSRFAVRHALQSERRRREHEAVIQISEFRQRWINEFRDRISEFAGIISVDTQDQEIDKEVVELVFKIELLVNPKGEGFAKLRAALKYRADARALGGTKGLNTDHDNLLEVTQQILKREWTRLKKELRDPGRFVSAP